MPSKKKSAQEESRIAARAGLDQSHDRRDDAQATFGQLLDAHCRAGTGRSDGKKWLRRDLAGKVWDEDGVRTLGNWLNDSSHPNAGSEKEYQRLLEAFGLLDRTGDPRNPKWRRLFDAAREVPSKTARQQRALGGADPGPVKAVGSRQVALAVALTTDTAALPSPDTPLDAATRLQLRAWCDAAFAEDDIAAFVAHRYAYLRLLLRLGGDESGGFESFVNLHLQPRAGAESVGDKPEPFDSLPKMLADVDGRAAGEGHTSAIWQLVGAPGAGKSTLLLELEMRSAYACAMALRGGGTGQRPELCVRLSLARFDADAKPPVPIEAWLAAQWREIWAPRATRGQHAPPLETLRRTVSLRVVLDGLNEISAPHAKARQDAMAAFARWAADQVEAGSPGPVFTVRSLNYVPFPRMVGHAVVRVADVAAWTLNQIRDYCRRRAGDTKESVWDAMHKLPRGQQSGLLALLANPFNLAIQCWLFEQSGGQLAADRATLMGRLALQRLAQACSRPDESVLASGLLDRDEDPVLLAGVAHPSKAKSLHEIELVGPLVRRWESLAIGMQRLRPGAWYLIRNDEADLPGIARHDGDAALMVAESLLIADKDLGRGRRFAHQLWQEYFAACALARMPVADWPPMPEEAQPETDPTAWELAPPVPSPWDQCAQLAAQIVTSPQALISHLMAQNLPLAARMALASGQRGLDVSTVLALKRALRQRSGDARVPLAQRVEAGELLGELGDCLRYAVRDRGCLDVPFRVPKRWIRIPAGEHSIGGLADDPYAGVDFNVTIESGLRLAFAPVSVGEFRCFVERDGYGKEGGDTEPPPWWEGEDARLWWQGKKQRTTEGVALRYLRDGFQDPERGAAWLAKSVGDRLEPREFDGLLTVLRKPDDAFDEELRRWTAPERRRSPRFWEDPRFNNPLQPVVGITLYEARAYCAWLSRQWGRTVRLPTEAEWEVAARGGERRGPGWPAEAPGFLAPGLVNDIASKLRRTSPVGCFPASTTPEGWVDLCGQVWEWTSSRFTAGGLVKAEAIADANTADDSVARAVRGGSWDNPPEYCRAAFRNGSLPTSCSDGLGFRLVCCPIQIPGP